MQIVRFLCLAFIALASASTVTPSSSKKCGKDLLPDRYTTNVRPAVQKSKAPKNKKSMRDQDGKVLLPDRWTTNMEQKTGFAAVKEWLGVRVRGYMLA